MHSLKAFSLSLFMVGEGWGKGATLAPLTLTLSP